MMADNNKPLRNVFSAISFVMDGKTFASFRDRIEVRDLHWWNTAVAGAVAVLNAIEPESARNRELRALDRWLDDMYQANIAAADDDDDTIDGGV
jgi:hypothetical protein